MDISKNFQEGLNEQPLSGVVSACPLNVLQWNKDFKDLYGNYKRSCFAKCSMCNIRSSVEGQNCWKQTRYQGFSLSAKIKEA